jgi:hypothetical protein
MNKRSLMIVFVVGMLALSAMACEFSASTAAVKDAYLAADEAGTQKTTEYTPEQAFTFIVTQANAPDDTKLKAVWYSVDEAGKATQFVEKEMVTGGSPVTFTATNNGPWPVGKYKVELYLNDKLDRSLDFSVK